MTQEIINNYYNSFQLLLSNHLSYEVKYIHEDGDVMGNLLGLQFDSDSKGGYIYLWSSGLIGYHFLNYETGKDIIADTLEDISDESVKKIVDIFSTNL